MTFLEKQKNIINKLECSNYSIFDGNKEKALDFIETHMLTIIGFTPDITKTYIKETIRDIDLAVAKNETLSKTIVSINALNTLCHDLDIEPFMDVDTTNTDETSQTVNEMISQIFNIGINNH